MVLDDQFYVCICSFTKVPFDAKKYFFSYNLVPFQNFSFATLVHSEFLEYFFIMATLMQLSIFFFLAHWWLEKFVFVPFDYEH